ncbi:MAG TPA: YfhO family protein, partial [Acidimicrobiia bacterium]
ARAARRAPSSQWSYFVRHAVVPGLAIVATAVIVVLALRASSAQRVQRLALVVPCIVAVEALAFVVPWWPRTASADYYPATPTTQFLAANLHGNRYAADNDTLFPSANTVYKLRAVSGHAFKEPAWRDLVASIDPTQPQGSTVLTISDADKTATSPILDRLAARYFVAQPGVPVYGTRTPPPASSSTFTLADGDATTFTDRGALRAVVVRAPQGFARGGTPAYLDATVRDASGKVVAQGRRPLLDLPPIDIDVAVTGDALGSDPHTVTLRLDAPGRTLTLAGTRVEPAHGTVRPPAVDDGLRVRFAGDTVIYQRTTALDRVHWASHAIVERSAADRLSTLHEGYAADAVLLDGPSPAASGAPAHVAVQADEGDSMRVAVDAQGAGYLVVADALQQGWKVTVDGKPAALRPADGAVVAVAVGAGNHVVHLWYDPNGRKPALVLSVVAVLVCLALAAMMVLRRRRPSTAQETT